MTRFECVECKRFSLPAGEFIVTCPGCRTSWKMFAFLKDRKDNTLRTRLERWIGYKWMQVARQGVEEWSV